MHFRRLGIRNGPIVSAISPGLSTRNPTYPLVSTAGQAINTKVKSTYSACSGPTQIKFAAAYREFFVTNPEARRAGGAVAKKPDPRRAGTRHQDQPAEAHQTALDGPRKPERACSVGLRATGHQRPRRATAPASLPPLARCEKLRSHPLPQGAQIARNRSKYPPQAATARTAEIRNG